MLLKFADYEEFSTTLKHTNVDGLPHQRLRSQISRNATFVRRKESISAAGAK